ncbi:hypothetical protein FB451DRAFT_1434208 [Mycena latifolia]|nr:hypothetical protein FB451DRAFT_1434208 [Mycena latifolia]
MDFELHHLDGSRPVLLWSVRGGLQWASYGAPANEIPSESELALVQAPPFPPKRGILSLHEAALYQPREHWLGWAPTCAGDNESDPSDFIFDQNPVSLKEVYDDSRRADDSDDEHKRILAGFALSEEWCSHTLYLSRALHDIGMKLVQKSDFYGPNSWTTHVGDMPEPVNEDLLWTIHFLSSEAQEVANNFRRSILSQMAFINWFSTIQLTWLDDLDQEERDLLKLLNMENRPKKGYVFCLTRDYHEINLPHLYAHKVPFHYAWTQGAAADGRFLRLSPEFQAEYANLVDSTYSGLTLNLSRLPSFPIWKEDLERYDVFFQDARVGRVGGVLTHFRPYWEYTIIDFLHYGARPVDSQAV